MHATPAAEPLAPDTAHHLAVDPDDGPRKSWAVLALTLAASREQVHIRQASREQLRSHVGTAHYGALGKFASLQSRRLGLD